MDSACKVHAEKREGTARAIKKPTRGSAFRRYGCLITWQPGRKRQPEPKRRPERRRQQPEPKRRRPGLQQPERLPERIVQQPEPAQPELLPSCHRQQRPARSEQQRGETCSLLVSLAKMCNKLDILIDLDGGRSRNYIHGADKIANPMSQCIIGLLHLNVQIRRNTTHVTIARFRHSAIRFLSFPGRQPNGIKKPSRAGRSILHRS